MRKAVKCASCGKEYLIDLTKFGGKKIRCKQCQAAIDVPSIDDEFEIIEECQPPTDSIVTTNTDADHVRPISLEATNTAADHSRNYARLLRMQQTESRSAIRRTFLERQKTLQDELQSELKSAVMGAEFQGCRAKIAKWKDLHRECQWTIAETTVYKPTIPTPFLLKQTNYRDYRNDRAEHAFDESVELLGSPVRELPKMPKEMPFVQGLSSVFSGKGFQNISEIRKIKEL